MNCNRVIKENFSSKKVTTVLAIVAASSEKVRYYTSVNPLLSGFVSNWEIFKRQTGVKFSFQVASGEKWTN